MKRNIIYSFIGMLICVVVACTDDILRNEYGPIPEGESRVTATVEFQPLRSALETPTRATGDAIKTIDNLWVLLYNEKSQLVQSYPVTSTDYTLTEVDRTDEDVIGDTTKTAEARTQRATFTLKSVPYGRYHIYAVANMGNFEAYKENIQTVEGLKSIRLKWESEIGKNKEMFGYFTEDQVRNQDEGFVEIKEKNMKLHAWIRRAASKVTVAYDASGLKEGVFIYLKSVQIKDIPDTCFLGKDNKPGEGDKLIDGEMIKYYDGAEPPAFNEKYPVRLSTGVSRYGAHGEQADALFFYENLQGEGEDKRQDANKDGELDYPGLPDDPTYRPKDEKPYGSYIEVDAFYVSINPEKVGSGNIKYRFMLGKNVTTDYNAERNHHYKLTLKFKNFANDADWHIEYKEPEPGIEIPNPYYISYLYNHSMMLPMKINTGSTEVTVQSISAKIVDNRWAPNETLPSFKYWRDMDKPGENCWNGFLSLHRTTETVLTGSKPFTATSNKAYYEQEPKRGERLYSSMDDGEHTTNSDALDKYRVKKEVENGVNLYHVSIPMYTRAKQLIKQTAYTGNNPYVAYQRKAEVEIKATLSNGNVLSKTVTIYQVRRVVNPKGVWRKASNNKPFKVVLKRLPREEARTFETFPSEGPWKAYVVRSTPQKFIHLTGGKKVENDTVYGLTGSNIDFSINFTGTCGEKENRYAIIRVEYHNYSCYHLIFVRQGDASDNLISGGTKWHAYNMKTRTEETKSPLEEGSMFRFGNWGDPIDALNNKNPKTYWTDVTPDLFSDDKDKEFTIAGAEKITKKWDQIPYLPKDQVFDDPNPDWRIASYNDYVELYRDGNIEQGYGILYGDGAETTADDLNDAYGYDYEGAGNRGMRGCFVYHKETGKNLFFPIGASGYGHRKNGGSATESGKAVLRYAVSRSTYFPNESIGLVYPNGVSDAPLFYDIYMRPGAIYWINRQVNTKDNIPAGKEEVGEGDAIGWDFNYFTFDFFPITTIVAPDACFIRCVDKK